MIIRTNINCINSSDQRILILGTSFLTRLNIFISTIFSCFFFFRQSYFIFIFLLFLNFFTFFTNWGWIYAQVNIGCSLWTHTTKGLASHVIRLKRKHWCGPLRSYWLTLESVRPALYVINLHFWEESKAFS